jgi:RNA polymerase sigma factor (sigma-70 family)
VSALVENRTDSDDDSSVSAGGGTDVAISEVADPDGGTVAGESHPDGPDSNDPDRESDGGSVDAPDHPGPTDDASAADVDPLDIPSDPVPLPAELRADFGAHFEDNYRRLVAQLYAITLDSGQAHDAVQDAYARAWRRWATVGASADPTAWVRGVAVRSTIRSWRHVFGRFAIGRTRPNRGSVERRTAAMLTALRGLPAPERRAIVLTYMAGSSAAEIAAVEQVSYNTVQARLSRGRRLITENLADDLPALLGPPVAVGDHGDHDWEEPR